MIQNPDRKVWVKVDVTPEIESFVIETINKKHPVISKTDAVPHRHAFYAQDALIEIGVCGNCLIFRIAFCAAAWNCEESLYEVMEALNENPDLKIALMFEECKKGAYKGFKAEFYNTNV